MPLQEGSIDEVIKILQDDQNNDYFNCICITARVRKGKSRLAKYIIDRLYPQFTYEDNYIGNPKHFQTFKKLFNAPAKSTSWIDEAEKVLSAERRFDKEQWYLQQLFNQFASHNKIIILCTPSFRRIDSRWRDTHITIWISIIARGVAVLHRAREMQSSLDIWGLEAMKETEASVRAEDSTIERILKNYDKNPTALFYFKFPDWGSEEEKAEYTKYKEQSQADLADEFNRFEKFNLEGKDNKDRLAIGRLTTYFNYKYQISMRELSALMGINETKLGEYRELFLELIAMDNDYLEALPKRYFSPEFIEAAKGTLDSIKI